MEQKSEALSQTNADMHIQRNFFESFRFKASEKARKYGIDPHFEEKRQMNAEKYFDELALDYRLGNRKEIFTHKNSSIICKFYQYECNQ